MHPNKVLFALLGPVAHVSVGLPFDVHELGRVEPGGLPVRGRLTEQGAGQYRPHVLASIPNRLYGPSARCGLAQLGAVAGGVDVRQAGLQVLIHQKSLLGFDGGAFGQLDAGVHPRSQPHKLAGEGLACGGGNRPGSAAFVPDDLFQLGSEPQVDAVTANFLVDHLRFFRRHDAIPKTALPHQKGHRDVASVQHFHQFNPNQSPSYHHRMLQACRPLRLLLLFNPAFISMSCFWLVVLFEGAKDGVRVFMCYGVRVKSDPKLETSNPKLPPRTSETKKPKETKETSSSHSILQSFIPSFLHSCDDLSR
jgi:hypothetical protein